MLTVQGPGMQFIVISLKTGFFQGSEALVGVYRDQGANSSKTLTLDVRCYSPNCRPRGFDDMTDMTYSCASIRECDFKTKGHAR